MSDPTEEEMREAEADIIGWDPEETPEFTFRAKSPLERHHIRMSFLSRASRGMTTRQIAEEFGCSERTVVSWLNKALRDQEAPDVATVRAIMARQLDNLAAPFWADALAGDVKAAETVLKVLDRKAKLHGADAPVQLDAVVTTVSAEEQRVALWVAQAGASAITVDPLEVTDGSD